MTKKLINFKKTEKGTNHNINSDDRKLQMAINKWKNTGTKQKQIKTRYHFSSARFSDLKAY